MEQEETKTTAAAGVEMPPEAESWVQLHESELTELMQKQARRRHWNCAAVCLRYLTQSLALRWCMSTAALSA